MDVRTGPIGAGERIGVLDTIRGFAVLGILTMNVVSYGLGLDAYFNLNASSPQGRLDWLVGGLGEVFCDQKFMGLFSMLFGAGIVLFADRAAAKGRGAVRLALWRNVLLLLFGAAHAAFWDGDVLLVYGACAPVLILLRRLPARGLLALGAGLMLVSPWLAWTVQARVDAGAALGEYWGPEGAIGDAVGIWLLVDFFSRALGMMLVGVAAYRTGFLRGESSAAAYRRAVVWGLGTGLPLSAAGLAWVAAADFGPEVAVAGSIPNSLATLPVVLGYVGLITLWHRRTRHAAFQARVRAVGRMALTNYLSQTALGLIVLRGLAGDAHPGRAALFVFVLAVWALQLWWSPWWLARRRFGPLEWLWRAGTYRRRP